MRSPSPLPRWLCVVPNLLRRRRFERDLADELAATLDELTAEKIEQGLPAGEARRQATLELGGVEQVKEAVREERSGASWERLAQDARFALRALARARGFALVTCLTLALGIGGTTAIFSVVAAALAAPEYPESVRLVHLWAYWPGGFGNFGYPDFRALVEQNDSFERVAAYERWGGVALTGVARPVTLAPSFVTQDYLPLLGARPVAGRLFLPEENGLDDGRPVAVVSHACWQRELAGDPAIVGRSLVLNGSAFTVIGILAPGFRDLGLAEGGVAPDLWLPAALAPRLLGQPPLTDPYSIYWGLGLLRPGVTPEQARQNLAAVAVRRAAESPATRQGHGLDLQPLGERMTGPVRRPALLLFAGAALILALGCVNIANALLVRLSRRRGEMAVRAALGASTGRLVQQLLVEAGLLALVGGAAGIGLALVLTRVLGAWVQGHVAALVTPRADGVVLLCAVVLALGTLAIFGLVPALAGGRVDLRSALGHAAGKGTQDGRARLRRGLVVAEVALSTVLLVGAALMAKSVARLLTQGLGYDSANLLTLRLDLAGERYADRETRIRFARDFEARVAEVPGVRSVSLLGPAMLGNATWVMSVFPREREPAGPEEFVQVFRHSVSSRALANLGIRLLAGRQLDDHDTAESPLVAIVSEGVARVLWPGEEAVGRQLRRPDPSQPPITVVGVAGDVQHRNRYSLDDIAAGIGPCGVGPQRDIYLPLAQRPNLSLTAALRIAGDSGAVSEGVRRAVEKIDPGLPVNDVAMLDDRLAAQESAPAAIALLFGAFAAFALFLAGIGLYGVIAQAVEQRAREIGIRLALGARGSDVLRRFVGGGAGLALAGAALGSLGAMALARLMASLLFGVEALDPATFLTVVGLLLATAVGTAWVPTRRVLARGAVAALREE